MDTTEIHYLTYDPEKIYEEMQYAYIAAGGDALYPGDEKEMLLRAVQAVMVQAFAGMDNALRMATLRYAAGGYLDLYGEKRLCYRMEEQNAKSTVEIKFLATGKTGIIEAGTPVTADGAHLYFLDEDVAQTGYQQTIQTEVTANDAGSKGNGLLAGTQMQFLAPYAAVESIFCIRDAAGGQEREDDETYRERIRNYGLTKVTTGTEMQYEAAAKSVTSQILDAKALNIGAGKVGIYLLLDSEDGADAILANVEAALNPIDARPMTDFVKAYRAAEIPYTLNVLYKVPDGSNLSAKIAEVVDEYQKIQDTKIGRAFDPGWLIALIYQAGATRVMLGEGSEFNGGPAEYTEIAKNEHCKGTISLGVIP